MLALDWPMSMEFGSGGKSLQDIKTTYSWFGFKVFLFFSSASAKSRNCPHSPTSTRWINPILRPTLAPNQISVWGEVFPSAKLLLRAFQNPQSWYLISNSVGLSSYPLHHWFQSDTALPSDTLQEHPSQPSGFWCAWHPVIPTTRDISSS